MGKRLLPMLLLAVTLCACGAQSDPAPASPDAVGMDEHAFTTASRTIERGTRMEFVNNGSRALHVLVLGEDARPRAQAGAPSFGGHSGHRSEVADDWKTPAWDTPGTYSVTCTLHPSMNLAVTVR